MKEIKYFNRKVILETLQHFTLTKVAKPLIFLVSTCEKHDGKYLAPGPPFFLSGAEPGLLYL